MVVYAWNPCPWEEADSERSAKDTRKNFGRRWEFKNSLGYTQGEANPGSVRPCLKKTKTKTEVKISISFYQLWYPWWVTIVLRTWNFCSQNRLINCTIISVPAEEVVRKCWLLLSGQVGLMCVHICLKEVKTCHVPFWRVAGTQVSRSLSTVIFLWLGEPLTGNCDMPFRLYSRCNSLLHSCPGKGLER